MNVIDCSNFSVQHSEKTFKTLCYSMSFEVKIPLSAKRFDYVRKPCVLCGMTNKNDDNRKSVCGNYCPLTCNYYIIQSVKKK